nr:hypothetical protein [Streptomyces microflavus]
MRTAVEEAGAGLRPQGGVKGAAGGDDPGPLPRGPGRPSTNSAAVQPSTTAHPAAERSGRGARKPAPLGSRSKTDAAHSHSSSAPSAGFRTAPPTRTLRP